MRSHNLLSHIQFNFYNPALFLKLLKACFTKTSKIEARTLITIHDLMLSIHIKFSSTRLIAYKGSSKASLSWNLLLSTSFLLNIHLSLS
jgi:hypothetical protein